jgi:predicted GTPase
VLACGADFTLLGPRHTMLQSARPVIAVSAVRTGCGKSQVARWLVSLLREQGLMPAVIRHPMPYGEIETQRVQRFASREDLESNGCTIEEREEFEPHLERGAVVFAGVDYREILQRAEQECGIIVWDGGNNDFPFVRPDLHIVLVDALRAGDEVRYHPGEAVLRTADVVLIAKSERIAAEALEPIIEHVRAFNPSAAVVRGASPVRIDPPTALKGKRVLVIEDGPTLTHGGMAHGAGWRAATDAGAVVVDPRRWAGPELSAAFAEYPHIGPVLPALGYFPAQIQEMRALVENCSAQYVVCGTPIDLAALLAVHKPVLRARYDFAECETPGLRGAIMEFLYSRSLIQRTRH